MNLLLTSVGRRNYMVDYFKRAINGEGKVVVSNSIPDTSGMYDGDKAYLSPPIKSDRYIPFLLDICCKENISAIIPLFDIDSLAISKNKDVFRAQNIIPVVSEYNTVINCFDKIKYPDFLSSIKVNTPRIFCTLQEVQGKIKSGELNFPVIIKPRWGTGSITTELANNFNELNHKYKILTDEIKTTYLYAPVTDTCINSFIIQEFIKGDEYGMDIINDLQGNYVKTFVRKKLSMRSGETDGAITVQDKTMSIIGEKIGKELKHIALLDVDFIVTPDFRIFVIDMNARFGGGYPFIHQAGVNIPLLIVKWLRGQKTDYGLLNMKVGIKSVKGISIHSKKDDNE